MLFSNGSGLVRVLVTKYLRQYDTKGPGRGYQTKYKYKELTAQKLIIMKQELVQTRGDNFVAEAQLTNVTPAKTYKQPFAPLPSA